ncbi:uncharacterized protein LOC125316161 [Rhodamnia argentea]|uniref:Uncharacterized protein LOC125316161 n=1 Tax=Rhodamnia argentea TaxID=178133 RepID=A0ABM3HSK6_9MYRT|nr:uncharacterized protein LOC125316161 [Rhodamnia argentea]
MPLEDVVITGTSSGAPSPALISQASPVTMGPSGEMAKLLAQMEQRIREVEGTHNIPQVDFSAFSKVNVPEKFKMPDFEKYDGTSNPVQHVQMYQARMSKYVANGPLMIQTFQAGPKDAAMRWYTDYEIYSMENWEKVANAFIKHFSFNLDVLISREDLEQAEMKKGETIKQYATRWRNVASRLKPVPPERELMKLFVSTLPRTMRSRILGSAATSFSHLIAMAEEIESGMKKGWYGDVATSTKRFTAKKDKEPVSRVNMTYAQKPMAQVPVVRIPNQQRGNFSAQRQKGNLRPPRQFTPLHGTPSRVLAVLRKKGLLTSEPLRLGNTNSPRYDPSKKCDYHCGEPGHDADGCYVLKHRIQDLLDSKAFSFQDNSQPNTKNNPLPDHSGKVNAVFSSEGGRRGVFKIRVVDIFNALVRAGYYRVGEIVSFANLEQRISTLMENGLIVRANQTEVVAIVSHIVIDWDQEFAALALSQSESSPKVKAVEADVASLIKSDPELADMPALEDAIDDELGIVIPETLVITSPQPFPYKDGKAVPWSYDLAPITRSGRTYNDDRPAKQVAEKDAKEFLAVIKTSEYNIVDRF